jgi:hypothetical protein
LGGPGDLILAHHMLGHNIGGNYASEMVRRAVYFRLRSVGHQHRWRECLCDEQLEFDPVRAALNRDVEKIPDLHNVRSQKLLSNREISELSVDKDD